MNFQIYFIYTKQKFIIFYTENFKIVPWPLIFSSFWWRKCQFWNQLQNSTFRCFQQHEFSNTGGVLHKRCQNLNFRWVCRAIIKRQSGRHGKCCYFPFALSKHQERTCCQYWRPCLAPVNEVGLEIYWLFPTE